MTIAVTAASPVAEVVEVPVVDVAAVVAPDATVSDANAGVSSAPEVVEDAKEPLTLLDVVKSAVEPVKEPVVSSDPVGAEVPAVATEEAAAAVEPGAEEEAEVPFHNHPRWKALLTERDSLKEPAESYAKITEFMGQHGLVSEEVAEGFEVMALLKSGAPADLEKALAWFEPRVAALRESVGQTLPADILQKLEDGVIDDDTATELAKARTATAHAATLATRETARTAEATAAEAAQTAAVALATAVDEWETRIKQSDPDYSKKAQDVENACLAIVARTGKRPTNAAEATALADEAYKQVNDSIKRLTPAPRTIVPSPTVPSVTAISAPTSIAEAIAAALNK